MQNAAWPVRKLKSVRRRLQILLPSVFLIACAFLAACPSGTQEPSTLAAIVVSPASASIRSGEKQPFTASGVFSDSSTQDLTALVSWTIADSSGTGIATIDSTGVATGTAGGSSIVTASYQGKSASAILQVAPSATLLALAISPIRPAVARSTTQQFTATATFSDGTTQDVSSASSWGSADLNGNNVASISASGLASANSSGLAAVTASYQGQTAATTLQVNNTTLSTLALTPTSPVVGKDLTVQFRVVGTFSDSSQQDLTAQSVWSVVDTAGSGVATITERGLCTAKSVGKATITATVLSKSASASLTVRDVTLASLTVLPTSATINKNATQQFTAQALYSDGSTSDMTDSVEWQASDVSGMNVASISAGGLSTGRSGGSARITARYGGKSAAAELTVSGSPQPAPVLNAITPGRGTTAGGTPLTLQGNHFIPGDTVRIAGVLATDVVVVSPMQIKATLPAVAGAFGLVPVVVTHPDGQSVTREDLFSYSASILSFGTASTFGVGMTPGATALADFNGDGKIDLAVNGNGSAVSVLLGTGTGTFGVPINFPTGEANALAVADFNGDTKLDILAANRTSNNVSLLLGTGDGRFVTAINIPAGMAPSALGVGDFNGDTKLDFVVVNNLSNNVSVMLGNGTGGFSASTFAAGTNPLFLLVRDFNNDTKLDLIISASNNLFVRLGQGDGTFVAGPTVPVTSTPFLAAGDLNGDGKLDLVTTSYLENKIEWRMGLGTGNFSGSILYPDVPGPRSPVISDFDGDGKADLAYTTDSQISVHLGTGTGIFSGPLNKAAGTTPIATAVADLNGDKKLDLVCANNTAGSVSVLLNTSQ